MDAAQCLLLHHLRRAVLSARPTGRVVVEFADGVPRDGDPSADLSAARHAADALLALVNLPMLGPHWVPVDRPRAAAILMAVLHWDLETLAPLVPEREAAALTGQVFGCFPDDATFLTNVRPHADVSRSPHRWASGTEADELDAGVAVVSPDLAGLVWVEDRP